MVLKRELEIGGRDGDTRGGNDEDAEHQAQYTVKLQVCSGRPSLPININIRA